MEERKISYLISFMFVEDREEFKNILKTIRYKTDLGVTEAIIQALKKYEEGLK